MNNNEQRYSVSDIEILLYLEEKKIVQDVGDDYSGDTHTTIKFSL
jgi:hypothetical protein